nr:hypothetical protein [uncultured Dysosmobacter sp.]
MKKYERQLKELITLSEGGCEPVHQTQTDISEADLRFLRAKDLITLHPAGDGEFYIVVAPDGLAYFSNKRDARAFFVKDKVITFVSGFVSGVLVTVVAAWIIQTM